MMPVARVMSLFRAHLGTKAIRVANSPAELDVTASRNGERVFLHVVNTSRTRSIAAKLTVAGMSIRSGMVFEIATDPEFEVWSAVAETLSPVRKEMKLNEPWQFPAASVSAIELECQSTHGEKSVGNF